MNKQFPSRRTYRVRGVILDEIEHGQQQHGKQGVPGVVESVNTREDGEETAERAHNALHKVFAVLYY